MAKTNITPPQLTPQEIERFWNYVDKTLGQGPTGECWRWTKGKSANGYGAFCAQKRGYSVHRLAYFLCTGKWTNLLVCHTCDWKSCCNPTHLFEGTNQDNSSDMVKKNRAARIGRPKLTPDEVLMIRYLCRYGCRNHGIIAKRFGVSRQLVTMIANRKVWKHLD